jgi:hypothetical protein
MSCDTECVPKDFEKIAEMIVTIEKQLRPLVFEDINAARIDRFAMLSLRSREIKIQEDMQAENREAVLSELKKDQEVIKNVAKARRDVIFKLREKARANEIFPCMRDGIYHASPKMTEYIFQYIFALGSERGVYCREGFERWEVMSDKYY